jgi:hypothetical protein
MRILPQQKALWAWALIGWALFAAAAFSRAVYSIDPVTDTDSDSMMRLAQIRDWLAGQGWFDTAQQRLGVPGGTSMHWTRLPDLLPAALILGLKPWLGVASAETVAAWLAPALLYLPFLWTALHATRRLAPAGFSDRIAIPVVLVSFQMVALAFYFSPGMLDHHNLQLIGLMAVVAGASGQRDYRSGMIAGSGAIFSLSVGPDAVLPLLAVTLGFGLAWAADPQRERGFVLGMGAAVLALAPLFALIFLPHPWSISYCDSWTVPVVFMMLGYGACLLAMAGPLGRLASPVPRAVAAVVLGLAAIGLTLWLFPACRDPLPLHHPLIDRFWMDQINENRNVVQVIAVNPFFPIGIYAVPALTLLALAYLVSVGWVRLWAALPALLAMLAAMALTLMHLRGWPTLCALTLPLTALVVARLHAARRRVRRIAGWVVFGPIFYILIGNELFDQFGNNQLVDASEPKTESYLARNCVSDQVYADLSRLPLGTIGASLNATPQLLKNTPHRGLAATYHRNGQANLEWLRWLVVNPRAARALPATGWITYVFACKYDPQWRYAAKVAKHSMAAALLANRPPNWLVPVKRWPNGATLYRVRA